MGFAATEASLWRSGVPWLAAVVIAGGGIGPVLLMLGLVRIQATTAAFLLNFEGIFTLVIAWTVFKEIRRLGRELIKGTHKRA